MVQVLEKSDVADVVKVGSSRQAVENLVGQGREMRLDDGSSFFIYSYYEKSRNTGWAWMRRLLNFLTLGMFMEVLQVDEEKEVLIYITYNNNMVETFRIKYPLLG